MNFSVFGPAKSLTGYDSFTRCLLKYWYLQGHSIHFKNFDHWSNIKISTDMDQILAQMEQNQIRPDFHLNFCLADQGGLNPTIPNFLATMFEADRVCQEWVQSIARYDAVIVPSEFNRKTFIESGVDDSKIIVSPIPLQFDKILNAKERPFMAFDGKDISTYKHRFLNTSEFISRKNVEKIISVWADEVKPEDDACLLLKLNANSSLATDFIKAKIDVAVRGKKCAPIYLFTQFISDDWMMAFYKWCTHYITMSYGEGWGVPESICGLLGKKVIAPNSTAFTEYLSPENAYLMTCNKVGAQQAGPTQKYYQGASWFAPLLFHTRKMIRESIKDANAGDFSKNERLSATVMEKCDPVKVSATLLEKLKNFSPKRCSSKTYTVADVSKNDYRFLMCCKSLQTKCGIADYTMKLYNAMGAIREGRFTDGLLSKGEIMDQGHIINNTGINLLHLQLEYQFASPERLKMLSEHCKNAGVKLVITMHTVNPAAFEYHNVLRDLDCDFIVSSEKMRNVFIEDCGMFRKKDRVFVVPMGVDATNALPTIVPKDPAAPITIGFFGFTYFHKGIEKILQYAAAHPNIIFKLLASKPENDGGFFDKVFEYGNALGLKNVLWCKDYLEESVVVKELSVCDGIFLPYSEYGGVGVSAAVRTCLKACVPIATFKNSFFEDVVKDADLIQFVGDKPNNYNEWSTGLDSWIGKLRDEAFLTKFVNDRVTFYNTYNWNNVAAAHLEFYKHLLTPPKEIENAAASV